MSRKMSRRFLVLLSVLALFLVCSVLSVTLWLARRAPQPPEPDLTEVDPDVVEAVTAARNKVQQQPNSGALWGRLGMVFFAHDFHDEAERSFAQAERLDPADARWPYLRGLSLVLTNPDASIPCFQRAAERCGGNPLAPRLRLAETLLSQGRLDEAELHLERARKAEPDNARVQLGLGRLAMLRGQWGSALEHLDPCTNDVHAQRLAHRLRAEAWTRLGEPDKARAEQRQAAEATKDQSWPDPFLQDVLRLQRGLSIRLQQAQSLLAQRRSREAVELLQETIQRYPHAASARLLLGEVWRHLGRNEQAEQAFAKAVQVDRHSPDAWFRLGCAQAARKRMGEAADSFRRAIRLKPDYADAHVNLGHCLQELGDAAGAADEFRAALRCRPDYERARHALREMPKNK
jgi:tetratricopeptide (TPR) repeat protein